MTVGKAAPTVCDPGDLGDGMAMTSYLEEYSRLRGCPVVADGRTVGRVRDLCMQQHGWQVPFLWLDGDGLDLLEAGSLLPGCRPRGGSAIELETREPRLLVARDGEQRLVWANFRPGIGMLSKTVQGCDEAIGRVVDLLVNTAHWVVRYWVVERGDDHVLLHTSYCDEEGDVLSTQLPRAAIETAPAYTGNEGLSPGYLDCLYRHYTQRRFAGGSGSAGSEGGRFGPSLGESAPLLGARAFGRAPVQRGELI
jgi:hypothetical protein